MTQKPIVLVGNPNCGKTTLFNSLTGAKQHVGNWSGVTIERKSGFFSFERKEIEIIDLPGIYTLTDNAHDGPEDEAITRQFLNSHSHHVVLNVVDAVNLERNLYLTLQLLEQKYNVVVALNRMDLAEKNGIKIDIEQLATKLGCKVIPIVARRGVGIQTLKAVLAEEISPIKGEEPKVLTPQARYELIEDIVKNAGNGCHAKRQVKPNFLDKITCHRYLGIPFFFFVMYALFFFAINVGGFFQDYFEQGADAIFVDGISVLLNQLAAPTWLVILFTAGVGKGISTILTFVPVIGAMFLALAFLEDSGYMARAAFVMDRLMRAIGLPGKAFVPMIIGFGCNVPAILATRSIENKRDRILTVMMSPFMSCGARLAIFTVFVAAFFPEGGQNIVFLLYMIGIGMAALTGLLLKKTLLKGEITPLILEMPPFQWPHWQSLWFHCWHRLRRFIFNAGKLILPVCVLVGVLNSVSTDGKWLSVPDNTSVLSKMGQVIVPVFKPLGMEEDNWPAAVGLLTGVLAKEVVIGTLNSLYTTASSEKRSAYGEMVKRFSSPVNAFAYLLFVLLYFPCVSATAAMVREVQKGWTLFSVFWTTGLAYGVAVLFYQCATFIEHPVQSGTWLLVWFGVGCLAVWGLRYYSRFTLPKMLPTPIVIM